MEEKTKEQLINELTQANETIENLKTKVITLEDSAEREINLLKFSYEEKIKNLNSLIDVLKNKINSAISSLRNSNGGHTVQMLFANIVTCLRLLSETDEVEKNDNTIVKGSILTPIEENEHGLEKGYNVKVLNVLEDGLLEVVNHDNPNGHKNVVKVIQNIFRKIFIIAFLFSSIVCFSQTDSTQSVSNQNSIFGVSYELILSFVFFIVARIVEKTNMRNSYKKKILSIVDNKNIKTDAEYIYHLTDFVKRELDK